MRNFQSIIKKIAKDNHTTSQEVLKEMQQAVDFAFDNPTPESRRLWNSMHFKGPRPTAEEFVTQIALMLEKDGGSLQ